MARPKDPNLDRAWRQRIQRQTSSGLSMAAFCRREGVSARLFYAWRERLKARPHSAPPEPPLFVPLHPDSAPQQAAPVLGRGVEMELPHDVRLRFDAPPEPEWLGRVVAVLADLPHQEATL
jgi:transposase-like protein